jgi:hypothetical protein
LNNNFIKILAQKMLSAEHYHKFATWWQYFSNISFKHQCPICRKHVKFLFYGLHPRPNAKCPFCGSLERHRSFWLFMKNKTDIFSRRVTILHFAPPTCLYGKFSLLPNVFYVTADIDQPSVSVRLDIQLIPFKKNSFDFILCSHVLEHVPDDQKAMRELFRILKPGGRAIIQVPIEFSRDETFEDFSTTKHEERERIFGQADHVRIYRIDYECRLSDAGFIVQFDSSIKDMPPDIIFRFGLSTQDIFLVSKPYGNELSLAD